MTTLVDGVFLSLSFLSFSIIEGKRRLLSVCYVCIFRFSQTLIQKLDLFENCVLRGKSLELGRDEGGREWQETKKDRLHAIETRSSF